MIRLPLFYRLGSRVRGPALVAGLPLLVLGPATAVFADPIVAVVLAFAAVALLIVGISLHLLPLAGHIDLVPVEPPVTGRWLVMNSPSNGVPSHGTNGHSQTFAIDLVHEPHEGSRPREHGFVAASAYPGFGRAVLAPADGRVVAAYDRARDHRARAGGLAYAYMLAEGSLREALGSRLMLGNHVTLDLGGGVFACVAHLQRESVPVRVGQRVRGGEPIGRCGNSGNSSEPHVHFQLMDRPRAFLAAGIPFSFPRLATRERPTGVPRNDEHLEVPTATPEPAPAGVA
jgi:hypothetical protein